MNDLRSSLALSGIDGFGGFDDLWGIEEGSRRIAARYRETVTFSRGRGVYNRYSRSVRFARGTKAKRKRVSGCT